MYNRCLSCNVLLTPQEKGLKYSFGDHIGLCSGCLGQSEIKEVFLSDEIDEDYFDGVGNEDYYDEY